MERLGKPSGGGSERRVPLGLPLGSPLAHSVDALLAARPWHPFLLLTALNGSSHELPMWKP